MAGRLKLFIPLIIFIVLTILFGVGLNLDPNHMPSALIDKPVPSFSLTTVNDDSKVITQDEFKGKVSLLNVWATWCVSCRVEHPYLVKLANQGIPIYGLNYKDDVPEAQKWLTRLKDPYVLSVVDADGRLGLDLGVFGAPETYVVDKEGVIRYRHVGVIDDNVWKNTLNPIVEALSR